MEYAICCVPVSPLRLESSHRSEMVSQLLFGETCIITYSVKDWVKVTCRYDQYEGWCQAGHVVAIDEERYHAQDNLLTHGWVNELMYNGSKMMVPLGSTIPQSNTAMALQHSDSVQFNGPAWNSADARRDEQTVRQFAFAFLNTPYLWGGRSVFGIDCSGFVQSVFRFLQVPLPRDAYQQATHGEAVGFLQEARCGDLAFFDNAEGRIIHVGILLNDHDIIHASVKVRVDKIDNQGILHAETFRRTHQLRIIKRFF